MINFVAKLILNFNKYRKFKCYIKFQKYRSHVYVKPKQKKIRVKTERDVEQQLGIKVERSNGHESNTIEQAQDQEATVDSWDIEKKSLIKQIMALKSENQLLVKNSNDKDTKLNSANVLQHELENRLNKQDSEYSTKLNELLKELHNAMEKEASGAKSISDLQRENDLLMAQNKQLQSGLAQTERMNSGSEETDIYEVERLLDDKLVSERHYLVRWKGFDSSNDTWERESNLNCASILKKYKRSHKKN